MNTALRWTIAIVGWLVLLIIYSVWKDVERHTGGGLITGFLRGLIVFGGAYYIYKWAKSKNYANNSLPEYINTASVVPAITRLQTSETASHAPPSSSPETISEGTTMKNLATVPTAPELPTSTHRNDDSEEDLWSQALTEFDGPNRRPGVWAKAYANAHGNEAVAKAQYLQERGNQLLEQRAAVGAAAEADRTKQLLARRENVAALKQAFLAGTRLSAEDIAFLSLASSTDRSLCQISERFKGETLLHWCARYGLEEEARTLLSNGANQAAVNGNGQRPASLAGPNSVLHESQSER